MCIYLVTQHLRLLHRHGHTCLDNRNVLASSVKKLHRLCDIDNGMNKLLFWKKNYILRIIKRNIKPLQGEKPLYNGSIVWSIERNGDFVAIPSVL